MSEGIEQAAGISFIVRDLPAGATVRAPWSSPIHSVLVVADEKDVHALSRLVPGDELRVTIAPEALDDVARGALPAPDCIVLTDRAAGVGALDAIGRLRTSEGRLLCAIVLVGADADAGLAVAALKAGALDVIPYESLTRASFKDAVKDSVRRFRQNEEHWRRAREHAHLAAIVTSSTDAIVSLDADGATVRSWSLGAVKLFGYGEADAIGRTIDELLIPHEKRQERQALHAAVKNGGRALLVETERRHKSGALVPVEINVSPIVLRPGVVSGYSVIFRDIGERRRTQEQLTRREAELSRAQRIARIGSYEVHCRNGTFLNRRSPEYLAIHGLPPEAENEPHEDWVLRMHPDDRGWSEAAFKKAVAEGAREYEAEYRITRPSDGQLRWIKVLAEIDRDASGTAVRLFGTHIDITERKLAEENVRLLMREVNHRAKNMLSLVQAIARQTVASNPKEFLKRFEERIQALARSQDLLVKSEWKGVDLDALAHSQLAHLQDAIDVRRISLSGPPVRVTASAAQTIGMALHELATNASKHGALSTDRGHVDITWRVRPCPGGTTAFQLDWIESGGPAVEQPVRRGFGSTITGAMARANLKGEAVVSYLPAGLNWRLTCPIERVLEGIAAPAEQASAALQPLAPAQATPSILVVEDEGLVALEIGQHVSEAGWRVLGPVGTVSDALALIYAHKCDAAVLDVNLGPETSEAIADELIRRAIPFVAVSGYSREQQPFVFRTCPLLSKPLQKHRLIAEIARISGLDIAKPS